MALLFYFVPPSTTTLEQCTFFPIVLRTPRTTAMYCNASPTRMLGFTKKTQFSELRLSGSIFCCAGKLGTGDWHILVAVDGSCACVYVMCFSQIRPLVAPNVLFESRVHSLSCISITSPPCLSNMARSVSFLTSLLASLTMKLSDVN